MTTTHSPPAAPTQRLTPYPDLSIGDYHAMANVSPSRLNDLARSPLHYWAAHVDPLRVTKLTTTAMVKGSALHLAALEPQRFDEEVAIRPTTDRRTKAGKAEHEAFEQANQDRIVLSLDDHADVWLMAQAIRSHRAASFLLAMEGLVEQSYTWVDPTTGLPCKCRPDWHSTGRSIVVDVKSTQDCSREAFAKGITNYGYHVQAAWNLDALGAEQFIWIAVESAPPYAVAVYPASAGLLDAGRRRITSAMATLAECHRSNHWPGPAGDLIAEPIDLPGWCKD